MSRKNTILCSLCLLFLTLTIGMKAQTGNVSTCLVKVFMYDSYGDGWNNAVLSLIQNDSVVANLTFSSGSFYVDSVVLSNDSVTLSWSQGMYDSECSFVISSDDEDTLYYGYNMSDKSGLFDKFYNTCSSCPRPTGLQLRRRSSEQLVLEWNGQFGSNWLVEYALNGSDAFFTNVTTADSIVLSDLQPFSTYKVTVRKLCDNGDTSRQATRMFVTECDTISCNYTLRFSDNYYSQTFMGGAIQIHKSDGSPVYTVTVPSDFYGYDSYYDYRFSACPGTLYFKYLNSSNLSNSSLNYRYIELLDADGQRISYFSGLQASQSEMYYDSVIFSCPTCYAVTDITVTEIDSSAATVRWRHDAPASYIVSYGLAGDEISTYQTFTVSDTMLRITGLLPNMEYMVYVHAVCSAGDSSILRSAYFTTGPRLVNKFYVSQSATSDTIDGTSWNRAFSSIYSAQQAALEQSNYYGIHPDIWVAAGTYDGGLSIYPAQHIYGGFAGNEPADYDISQRSLNSNVTVVDGRGDDVVYQDYNNYNYDSIGALWDGFTFTNGDDGAILNGNSTLRNCIVTNCRYGVSLSNGSSIESCHIVGNSRRAVFAYDATIDNTLIANNNCNYAVLGLAGNVRMRHCNVVNNVTSYYYAIESYRYAESADSLINCILWGNSYSGTQQIDDYGHIVFDHCASDDSLGGTSNIRLSHDNWGAVQNEHYVNFVSPNRGDYRLNSGSSCINAGTNITDFSAVDLAGDARQQGSAPDMGCYESDGTEYCNAPEALTVSQSTGSSVIVGWTSSSLSNFTLQYALAGTEGWVSVVSITDNNYLLQNLQEYTIYKVRVKGVCTNNQETDWSDSMLFNSGCVYPIEAVEITGYGNTTSNLPLRSSYPYSSSSLLFLSQELGNTPRSIDTIGFRYSSSTPMQRTIMVQMAKTDVNAITWSNIGDTYDNETVFRGQVTFTNDGWTMIPLQQPFLYDGSTNLVVSVVDTTGVALSNYGYFYYNTPGFSSLCSYGSSISSMYNYTSSYRPDIYFSGGCDQAPCNAPRLAMSSLTDTSVTLIFDRLSGQQILQHKPSNYGYWVSLPIQSFGDTMVLTGLPGSSDYEVRLRQVCLSGDTSVWVSLSFHTLPMHYQHIYVKGDAHGVANGSSWADAFTDLSIALNEASLVYQYYGERPDIWVASGTYYGDTTSSNSAFSMVEGINVYGGFVGNEDADFDITTRDAATNRTILDGLNARRVVTQNEAFYNSNATKWDGFTIRNGYSVYSNSSSGGGVYLRNGGRLVNCVVENCNSTNGGGVYSYYGEVKNCVIRGNHARSGSGIYSYHGRIERCTIDGNIARYNYHDYSEYGGGIYSQNDTVLRCVVTGDSTRYYGGGYFNGSYVENCLFADNKSYYGPAGVFATNSTIVGCDIVSNTAYYTGSSYSGLGDNSSTVTNCIVWGNRIVNSTNTQQIGEQGTYSHSAVEGGCEGDSIIALSQANNGNEQGHNYPMFAQPEDGDYRLMTGSPCIDAGKAHLWIDSLDVRGENRVLGITVDIGCYENNNEIICTRPVGISVTTAATAAYVSWQTSPSAESVELEYRATGDTAWTSIAEITGNHYLLEGLTANSNYLLRLRNYCGDSIYGLYTNEVTFATLATASTSLSYAADSVQRSTIGAGGTIYWGVKYPSSMLLSVSQMMKVRLYTTQSGTYAMSIYQGGDDAPQTLLYSQSYTFGSDQGWKDCELNIPLPIDNTKPLWVTFYNSGITYPASCCYFMGDPNSDWVSTNGTSWSHLSEYDLNYSWLIEAMFGSHADTSCPMPLLFVADITDTTANIVCQTNIENGVQLQYGVYGEDDYVDLTVVQEQTLSNLIQNTNYDVRVRTLCTNGDTSIWRHIRFTTLPRLQQHYYVRQTATGRGDGTSWDNATSDIEWIQSTAEEAYKLYGTAPTVWVAQGTYYGGFNVHHAVSVYGGFEGNEPDDYDLALRDFTTHTSVLDGQNTQRVLFNRTTFSSASDSATWDGFKIQNGFGPDNYYGGGANYGRYITLSNIIITDCQASYGGGVVLYSGAKLLNSTISNNTSNYYAALYVRGGMAENCLISNNTSGDYGSGVSIESGSVINSTIVNNYSHGDWPGVYVEGGTVSNSIIWGNRNPYNASQTSDVSGFYNCAVEGDVVSTSAAYNLILDSSNNGALCSPMFFSPTAGAGADYRGGDWHLQQGSVCVNRGTNSYASLCKDRDGNTRIQNDTIDIGCYESGYTNTSLAHYNNIVYVKPQSCGSGDGSSWANAMSDINQAQRVAKTIGGGSVWVATGMYYGGFEIVSGVSVYGGFAGTESSDFDLAERDFVNNTSVLDGQNIRRVLTQSWYYSSDTALSLWDGFTIQNGYSENEDGGGVYLRSAVRLEHCKITDCFAVQGGGIYTTGEGRIWLTNCSISNDSASYYCCILNNTTVENCLMSNNSSHYSPTVNISSSTITNSTVVRNAIHDSDNPVEIYDSQVNNSVFWGNRNNSGLTSAYFYSSTVNCSAIELLTTGDGISISSSNESNMLSPRFVQPTSGAGWQYHGGDWHLQQGSILVNRGVNSYCTVTTDLDGNQRIQNDTVDIGCYESEFSTTGLPTYDSIVYVRMTASGNADGTSWENAVDDINYAMQLAHAFGIRKVWVAQGTYLGDVNSSNAFTMYPSVSVYGGFEGTEAADYDISLRDFENHTTILDGDNSRRVLNQPSHFTDNTKVEWNGFTIQNGASEYGGAYMMQYSSLVNCVVRNNSGGGVYMYGGITSRYANGTYIYDYMTRLVNCRIVGNTSYNRNGGGVYIYQYGLISNCLISGNYSSRNGGGLYDYGGGSYIMNTTITNNTCGQSYNGGGVYIVYGSTLRNNIIWGNKRGGYYTDNLYMNYGYGTDLYNNAIEGDESYINLSANNDGNNPSENYVRFSDPTNGDYSLHPTSACVDMGDSTDIHLLSATDLAGNPRCNGTIDLGCYESGENSDCPSVVAMTASNVTNSSAVASWSPIGEENQWSVYLTSGTAGDDTLLVVTDTMVSLSGLHINRMYRAYVRAICDSSSFSIWSLPAVFTTLCDSSTLQPVGNFTSFTPSDNTVIYNSSVSLSWAAPANATSYDVYIWNANSSEPTTPTVQGLTTPQLNNALPGYTYGATYHWRVVAWNECINRISQVMTIRANDLPDLHVSAITNSTPVANQTMTIQWTVTNDGNGSTPPGATWNDYIWITGADGINYINTTGYDGVLLHSEPNLMSLEAGESYTNTATVTIPNSHIGNYYIFVLSDLYDISDINYSNEGLSGPPNPYTPSVDGNPYHYLSGYSYRYENNLTESNERDNFFYKVVNILPPPSPDLSVTHISHPTNTFSGNEVTVSWTVSNQGGAAALDSWQDAVYIQAGEDNELDAATALYLGSYQHSGGLSLNGQYTNSATVTIPLEYMGDYRFFVTTDVNNSLYESIFEENNTRASEQLLNVTLTPPPDLTPTSVSFPTTVESRGYYPIVFSVQNIGGTATRNGWYDRVYLSRDGQLDSSDVLLLSIYHSSVLHPDSSYTVNRSVNLPTGLFGQYNLIVKADANSNVFEYTYEDNNTIVMEGMVNVLTPDLAVTSIAVSDTTFSPGQTLQVVYSVANMGSGAVLSSYWRDAVYITPTASLGTATPVASKRHSFVLPSDSSYTDTLIVTIPADVTSARYVWVITDYQSNIFENNSKTNNIVRRDPCLAVMMPDLAITSVTAADTATAGGTMTVQWVVKNVGEGDLLHRSFRDNISFNGSRVYTAQLNDATLHTGDSIVRNATIKVPCGSSTGLLSITTDVSNAVAEAGNDANNVMSRSGITLLSPDLSPMVVTPADTLWSGKTYTVRYVLRNTGDAAVEGNLVTDRVFFSNNVYVYNNANKVAEFTRLLTILPGEEDTVDIHVTLPNGISGNWYLHVLTNVGDSICEGENSSSNVSHSSAIPVKLSPWPDLKVSDVTAPNEVNLGEMITMQYRMCNSGIANLEGQQFTNRIYYSKTSNGFNSANILYSHTVQSNLQVGDTDLITINFTIPIDLTAGTYYFFAMADADNVVYEHTGESNNSSCSQSVLVKQYPLDLMVEQIIGPEIVRWGQNVTYTTIVKNNSQYSTLASVWNDALYLSADNELDDSDTRLRIVEHRTTLPADSSYRVTIWFTMPMGTPSTAYLLAETDGGQQNPDINRANNVLSKQLTVNSIPVPDLAVSDFVLIDNDVVSGQTARATYKVTNVGDTALKPTQWTDMIFLSYDGQLTPGNEHIGSRPQHRDTLRIGEYYIDTISFTVPLPNEGSLYLMLKANVNNNFYETTATNNLMSAPVNVTLPLPGDLVAENIDAEDTVVSGSRIHVSWKVRNIGDNTMSGNGLRSIAYLSSDTVFDANDKMLGVVESNGINLASNATLLQSLETRLSGVSEGRWYIIVKTNVRNAFNEVNRNNNTTASTFAVVVVLRTLDFNTPTPDTLRGGEVSDFRLNVGNNRNETVRVHLESSDSTMGAVNMIYISHNRVGDNLNYDFSTIGQYTGNPELYIPATLPGYYGINLYGSTTAGDVQAVTISADIIPFELRSVSPSSGGNTGKVTVELTGSRFRPDMKVWMTGENDTLLPDTVIYVNYYKSYATFDLRGADTGLYDVGVLNFCEGEAVLADAFEVVSGQPAGLSYNLVFPHSPRPNRNIVMTLEFGNIGNVDITGAVLEVRSLAGTTIALTSEGLQQRETVLSVPLTIEGEPEGLLRPGMQGSIAIYGYTGGSLAFQIKQVQ